MSYVFRYWAPALGLAAIVAGVLVAQTAPESFGWYAYAPLSGEGFGPRFVTPSLVVGVSIAATGMGLLAGWIGYLLGRRSVGPR